MKRLRLSSRGVCFTVFLIAFLVVTSTTNANAAIYKWLQPYDLENGYNIKSYVEHPAEGADIWNIVADDWKCGTDLPVTGYHWWGSYWEKTDEGLVPYKGEEDPHHALETSPQFLLRIYKDVPAGPKNPYSHPGELIWQRPTAFCGTFVGHEQNPHAGGASKFQWDLEFWQEEKWFKQEEPGEHIYWLSISQWLQSKDPYLWGWETSSEHWNDTATYWNGDEWYLVAPEQTDMAFGLTTVPIPGAIWLLGSGLIGVIGLRRRKS